MITRLYEKYCKSPVRDLYAFPKPIIYNDLPKNEQRAHCVQAKIFLEDATFNFIFNECEDELKRDIIYNSGNMPTSVTPAELDRFQMRGILRLLEKFEHYASMAEDKKVEFDKYKVV